MTKEQQDKQCVLFVDDEPAVLDGLKRALYHAPFKKLFCQSGFQALEVVDTEHVDIVVADEQMPGMSGSDFLALLRKRHPAIIRIILSGQANLDRVINAINEGRIHRFLTKPTDSAQLLELLNQYLSRQRLQATKEALFSRTDTIGRWEWDSLHEELQWSPGFSRLMHHSPKVASGHFADLFPTVHPEDRTQLVHTIHDCLESGQTREIEHRIVLPDGGERWIVQYVDVFQEGDTERRVMGMLRDITDLKEKEALQAGRLVELQRILDKTVEALGRTTEIRDPYTAGHQIRVAWLTCELGRRLKLSEDRLRGLETAGKLHDLGKLYVPAEFLSKPGALREAEFNLIKFHPEVGYQILRDIPFSTPVAEIVLQHHERLDGSGYPKGLSGEDILFEARIIAVADVFEAMSSYRPYRQGLGQDAALAELTGKRGLSFDPLVVDALAALIADRPNLLAELHQFRP